jgi:hypothetical protein
MTTESTVLTIDECAADVQTKPSIILRHIQAGRLGALCLGTSTDRKSRAPKHYRIERDEWARFKSSIRLAPPTPETPEAEPVRLGRPPKGAPRTDHGLLGNYRGRGGG